MTRKQNPAGFAAAAAVVSVLLSIGCGGGGGDDDGNTPQGVAHAYATARNQGDAAALCSLYTPEIQQQTEPKQPCEEFVRERLSVVGKTQKGLKLSVMRVEDQGDTATAVIATEVNGAQALPATIPMQLVGDEWRVAGFDFSTGL
jgi:ketosteroid isomerase-like protein